MDKKILIGVSIVLIIAIFIAIYYMMSSGGTKPPKPTPPGPTPEECGGEPLQQDFECVPDQNEENKIYQCPKGSTNYCVAQ